jgi:hypothetical protein
MYESNASHDNEKNSVLTKNKNKSSIDPAINHIVSEYINCFKYDSIKYLIDHLENTTKVLQRSLFKPETKKDIKNENLLNFITSHPDDVTKIIGLFQKRISELKTKVNSDFSQKIQMDDNQSIPLKLTPSTLKIIPEEAFTNYFILENFDEFDENSNFKKNIFYLIIICPHLNIIYLLAHQNEVPLGWSLLNSILNNKCSSLEKIFNLKIEHFIEEKHTYFHINFNKLCEKIEINNEIKLEFTNKKLSLENFSLKKLFISNTNPFEELKALFLEHELHRNFISTNNTKLMKNLLECEMNYYSALNQISQMNLI